MPEEFQDIIVKSNGEFVHRFQNMRTDNDCGPVEVSTVTGVPYEEVMKKWPGGFNGNQSDSYIHHQDVLRRLGFRYKTISKQDILDGKFKPGVTAVMINALDTRETILPENAFKLHWCVFVAEKNAPGFVRADKEFFIWMGNGRIASYSRREMEKHMENPVCVAYTVEKVDTTRDLPFYKRWYLLLTSWI